MTYFFAITKDIDIYRKRYRHIVFAIKIDITQNLFQKLSISKIKCSSSEI